MWESKCIDGSRTIELPGPVGVVTITGSGGAMPVGSPTPAFDDSAAIGGDTDGLDVDAHRVGARRMCFPVESRCRRRSRSSCTIEPCCAAAHGDGQSSRSRSLAAAHTRPLKTARRPPKPLRKLRRLRDQTRHQLPQLALPIPRSPMRLPSCFSPTMLRTPRSSWLQFARLGPRRSRLGLCFYPTTILRASRAG